MNQLLITLVLAVSMLLLLGITALNSASTGEAVPVRFYDHLKWVSAGLAGCGALAFLDYSRLRQRRLPRLLLALALVLLGAVLVPGVGLDINGARRWFWCGGQPSELAKLALVIFLADYLAPRSDRESQRPPGFVYPGFAAALTALLVFVEPDWGTTLLLLAVAAVLLYVAGARWACLLAAGVPGCAAFWVLLRHDPRRWQRFISFMDPEAYQDGIGWQGWHSVLAIGSGGLKFPWFGNGSHKFGFVPEQQTDFIFSLIGEELGLAGTTVVVLLFVVVVCCGLRLAWRTTDRFGQLLATGLAFMIGLQAFINMGVATSVLPNKGIPLPFVSYGGSSTLFMLWAVGLLLSIARHAPLAPRYPRTDHPAPAPVPRAPRSYQKPPRAAVTAN
jgi:cell division protein FtsW